ncbi:hypothetical protein H4Q26_009742 [Puccinia striiformis f. sp. tritici PST-130]|nr:hypothetical protein H4Q26_009742 [Puccinia striiformis f. sp. tritici PST-130]
MSNLQSVSDLLKNPTNRPEHLPESDQINDRQDRGKSPNETALPGGDLGNPIPLAEVTASLNNKNRTKTGIQDDTIDDKDNDDTPQFISIRDGPKEAAIQQARQAQLALNKAVKAESSPHDQRT